MTTSFQIGDLVKANRQGAPIERVTSINLPVVYTEKNHACAPGGGYHHTKIVLIAAAK